MMLIIIQRQHFVSTDTICIKQLLVMTGMQLCYNDLTAINQSTQSINQSYNYIRIWVSKIT